MNRRDFIKRSSLTGIAVSTLAVNPLQSSATTKGTTPSLPALPEDFPLEETTIDDLQKKMQSGEYTSRSITAMYLQRIYEIDKSGPELNAVIELNVDALAIAEQMDEERKANKVRGPLHGIPVLIKDNIDTDDKLMTTAGSLALVNHKASADAFVVKKLREAGAVLLGKTNLSEWANFRSTRSASGWSSRGGKTKNPFVLNRTPCGSSSGSGAAVAANLCAVAIGTETDGSIIAPSSCCGIVGIKPTVGLLSRSGIIPISKTQDTAGPMARTVKDAAILLGALTGTDSADPITNSSKGRAEKDYTQFLDAKGLKGKRIGVEKSFFEGHEDVVALYKEAIEVLKKQGAEIVEVELLKLTAGHSEAELTVLHHEFKDGLNKYLAKANTTVKSLKDVIAFNKENEAKAMPFFKQDILETSEATKGLTDKKYLLALAKTTGAKGIISTLMKASNLHAIVGTSIGLPWCTDLINGDFFTGFYFCPPAAMAGYPHITVPMGKVHDLPIGLSFVAESFKEKELIAYAYAYEQGSKKRQAPKFLESIV